MDKTTRIPADGIRRLLPDMGRGIVSNKVTVDGKGVDYMWREEPGRKGDSGWRFYGGGETEEYANNPENLQYLDLNTIANSDPGIVRFVSYPPGTQIERNSSGDLTVLNDTPTPDLIFLGAAGEGTVVISANWSLETSSPMLKRLDDGNLVIWRPGLTLWINIRKRNAPVSEQVAVYKKAMSSEGFDAQEIQVGELLKFSYQLVEDGQKSYCLFGFTPTDSILMSAYFDDESDRAEVESIWSALRFQTNPDDDASPHASVRST